MLCENLKRSFPSTTWPTSSRRPLLYQNNLLDSNTDVSTYDLVGTFYPVSLSDKF
jgi:hypothetical protein